MNKSKMHPSELTKAKKQAIKQFLQKKFREDEGKFLIEGWKAIEEALHAHAHFDIIVCDEVKAPSKRIIARLEKASKEYFRASGKDVDALSDAVTSQGVVAVLPKISSLHSLSVALTKPSAVIVAVDGINDPGNLGTIIRTSDWFGIDAVVVSKNSAELYNPKTVRATMGSLFHLPVIDDTDLIAFLKKCKHEGFTIYTTGLNADKSVLTVTWQKKSVVLIGSESHGVSSAVQQMGDHNIMIPKFGAAESLNAAMACGIILSHMKVQAG